MRHRFWHAPLWRVAAVVCLAVGMAALPLSAPTPVAAATIRYGADNRAIPLLLVHGFTDTCYSAWNVSGANSQGVTLPQPNSDAWTYLTNSGFSNIREVGYYNTESRCDENLVTDSGLTQCNSFGGSTGDYGTKNDRLDRLSCLLSWYIYANYTQYGEPVNVLAHSMGGLLIRFALGATAAHAAYLPPVLWVNNVVTVATPHGGLGGPYHQAAANNGVSGVQFDMMNPANTSYSFMSTIGGYQRPQGWGGTRWALITASDASNAVGDGGPAVSFWASVDGDGVVPTDSQLAMLADWKVEYGARTPSLVAGNVADLSTQYEHETGLGCYAWIVVCFNGPYFLNDSSGNGTQAWTCSMCAGAPGGSPVAMSRSLLTIATELQQKPVPDLPTSGFVFRSNANGYYVSAELGYTGASYAMLRARAGSIGAWESWTRVQLPTGHYVIRNNANGYYVSAELGYAGANYGELRARTPSNGIGPTPSEIFDFVGNADGTYSLRSVANGLFVSAELAYTGSSYAEMRARASGIGGWEEFNYTTTGSGGCVNYGAGNITGPDSCAGTFSSHSIWFSGGGLGLLGREIWTYANGSVQDSTARWQLSGLSGLYITEIDAFIPRYHSNATHVHYTLCGTGNACNTDYVNQSPYYDQWAVVGYLCTTDGAATVTVADDGGDTYPRQIAADAVRGVRTTMRCTL